MAIKKLISKVFLGNQQGAMFGLDARISLLIFATLSVVTGALITTNLTKIRANAMADELSRFTAAVEGIHQDIKMDLHTALITPSDEGAVEALFNPDVLQAGRTRARWLGPYIKYENTIHPKYGQMALTKMQEDHSVKCSPKQMCFLWLTFDNADLAMTEELNSIFDGDIEEYSMDEGRIQWEETSAHNDTNPTTKLYFKISRALKI